MEGPGLRGQQPRRSRSCWVERERPSGLSSAGKKPSRTAASGQQGRGCEGVWASRERVSRRAHTRSVDFMAAGAKPTAARSSQRRGAIGHHISTHREGRSPNRCARGTRLSRAAVIGCATSRPFTSALCAYGSSGCVLDRAYTYR